MSMYCGISIRNLVTCEDRAALKEKLQECLRGKGASCPQTDCKEIIPRLILSQIQEMESHIKEAAEGYRRCLSIDGRPASIHFRLGRCEYFLMNFSAAINHLKEALKRDPDYSIAYYWIGRSYYSLMNFQKAVEPFEKLAKKYPQWIIVRFRLGELYEKLGRIPDALECYEKILNDNPANVIACYTLGRLYGKTAQPMKAIAVLREGLKHNPGSVALQDELENYTSVDMP